jgi:5-methylcytosine-specific restriction protein B
VPYAALIHPSNPDSGAYGGMSFVVFPHPEGSVPALFGLVLGTQGLSPDETILARPGHSRRARALCTWLNRQYVNDSNNEVVAWAKQDPVRIDQEIPDTVRRHFGRYSNVFDKYGKEVYAIFQTTSDHGATETALKGLLDLFFKERDGNLYKSEEEEARRIESGYFRHVLPSTSGSDIADTLSNRRYVILQGPPGTGKTRMALSLLDQTYKGHGTSIQFHPNSTYEDFIGGLAPVRSDGGMGFRFEPRKGSLMKAAEAALNDPERPYLLHIDEINRADLAKVLGEAVFLLEYRREKEQPIELPYDFGEPFGTKFVLPNNLHVLGTMNTSDRSIAILDVAIRRRFGFAELWPQLEVVQKHGCELTERKFHELLDIFVEHATDDSFSLLPGHSYFLEDDPNAAASALNLHLKPLLEEYVSQGYVAGFEEEIRSYIQSLESL